MGRPKPRPGYAGVWGHLGDQIMAWHDQGITAGVIAEELRRNHPEAKVPRHGLPGPEVIRYIIERRLAAQAPQVDGHGLWHRETADPWWFA